nr:uncharacterized protein LOC111417397 [Onthophagus taurus]
MDSYFLITLMLLTAVIVASSGHRLPQVREELVTSASSHSYNSPFEYGKTAQPDLQKWRYYQQQQADVKGFAKFKSHIQPLYPNKLDIQRDGWIPKVVTKSPRFYGITRKQDLDVQATENYNHNIEYLPNPQYLTGNIVYNQNNQDIAQLSNLLGQNFHQIPSNHQPEYQSQPILSQPQATHLQSELDILSQDNVQKLLQQAQQQAMDQVRLQHDALEKTRNEAEKAALAKIQAHNSGVADITLESASNIIEEKPINDQVENIKVEPLPIPQALTTSNEDHQSAIDHAISQAQAYLQQSSNIHLYNPTLNDVKFVDVKSTLQTPSNLYPQSYPLKPILNNIKIADIEPTLKTPSYSYPQNNINTLTKPTEDFTKNNDVITNNINTYVKNIEPIINQVPQKDEIEEINKEVDDYNEDYAEEYAPNYKFGYQIMDYHSGNDFGHEEIKDGKMTKGQYHILLPDGRTQNVEYWADASGYHAKVTYSNIAKH